MKRAFTLMEWLVSIAIVAVLLAILVPAVKRHSPQAEEPSKPAPRFTVTEQGTMPNHYSGHSTLFVIHDNTTSNEFLCVDAGGHAIAVIPLPAQQ
jgi:prepilin-type N-terminal cleavage/methylation domain-containing protein